MRMTLVKSGIVGLVGIAALIVGPTAATAAPATPAPASGTNLSASCDLTFIGSTAASVRCVGQSRQYRVMVLCEDPLRGSQTMYYGPWVNPGGTSKKKCPFQGGVQWLVDGANGQFR